MTTEEELDRKMGMATRIRRRISGDAIVAQSLLLRSCSVEKLSVQCSCKRHRGLKLVSTNDSVIRKNICPITWWLSCLNPGSWDTMKERQEWQNEHPLPLEDWDDYVNELVEDI
jgi:Mg2+ and Co2+ transporter CorA